MHIFHKTDDDNESRADSANYKHCNQNVVEPLKQQMHSKSVLRTGRARVKIAYIKFPG